MNRKRDFSTIYPSLVEKPVNSSALLVGGNHNLQAAHIRLQHFGDGHGAVGLQMVLQEGDQHDSGSVTSCNQSAFLTRAAT